MTRATAPETVLRVGPAAAPEVVRLGTALLERLDELTGRLVEAIVHEDASYAGPAAVEGLTESCRDNLACVLSVLVGDVAPGTDPYAAPRETGRRRAEQGVPVESVLHAYRLGFRTIWEGMLAEARLTGGLELLAESATTVWEVVDAFSDAVAGAYRDTSARLAGRDDRRREALLDALLDGRGAERAVAVDAAATLDLPEHGRYAVVVVAGTESGRSVADALAVRGLRSAWRCRADREIGVVALGRAGPADVVAAVRQLPLLRAGVSPAVDGLAEVDVAHRLAETTVRSLPPLEHDVVELDARLPGALLVTAPDLAQRLVRRSLGGLLDLETDERAVLLDTLTTWLDTGGSAGQTAARLYCHRNTVLNRLRRVEALTGRSLERVDHLVEWSLALLALQVLPVPG